MRILMGSHLSTWLQRYFIWNNDLIFYTFLLSVGTQTSSTPLPKQASASNSRARKLVRFKFWFRFDWQSLVVIHCSTSGMTALHIAAYFGEEEITRELFKHIPAYTTTSQVSTILKKADHNILISQPTRPENALIAELCYESGNL